jgi:hypothetical protein
VGEARELGPGDEADGRLSELRELSKKAESGDKDAKMELRRALKESVPEVVARCANTTRVYRLMLAEKSASGDLLAKEAIAEQAARMALQLAGDNPTPLETLLSERVASLWILVELQEALMAAYYSSGGGKTRVSVVLQMARIQESTHRRYLAAIKTLAQVQKMRGPSRVQVNIGENQVNVS